MTLADAALATSMHEGNVPAFEIEPVSRFKPYYGQMVPNERGDYVSYADYLKALGTKEPTWQEVEAKIKSRRKAAASLPEM